MLSLYIYIYLYETITNHKHEQYKHEININIHFKPFFLFKTIRPFLLPLGKNHEVMPGSPLF